MYTIRGNVKQVMDVFKKLPEEYSWVDIMRLAKIVTSVADMSYKRKTVVELMKFINQKDILTIEDEKYMFLIFSLLEDVCECNHYDIIRSAYTGMKNHWYSEYILREMTTSVVYLCGSNVNLIYLYMDNLLISTSKVDELCAAVTPYGEASIDYLINEGYKVCYGISKDIVIKHAFEFISDDEIEEFYNTFREEFNNQYNVYGFILE